MTHKATETDWSLAVAAAIDASLAQGRSVDLRAGSGRGWRRALDLSGWRWDSVEFEPGVHDVWGWTDSTPEGEHAWRLTVRERQTR